MRCDCCGVTSATIIAEAGELKVTGRTLGVATEGGTIYVERKATSETMIAISNIPRVTELERVRASHRVGAVDIEVGDEFCEEGWGGW